jgi:transcriptional regulator with XRE-family HTH domain
VAGVRDLELARALRAVRLRRGWRQLDVARQARVSRERVSDLEMGELGSFSIRMLRQIASSLDMDIVLVPRWRGGELARLLDAGHAALQNTTAARFEASGWEVVVERTFSVYGERGSIDLLAFHPVARILVVVEVKTVIVDIQELLSRLDAKTRLSRDLVEPLGWRPVAVVPCLIVADSTTTRRRVTEHAALFSRFAIRGRDLAAWLSTPSPASGALAFVQLPDGRGAAVRAAGRQRVRLSRRSAPAAERAARVPERR